MPATTQATSYRWGSLTPNALYFNNNKVWPTSLWTETFSAGDSATWPAPWAHTSKPATASASVAAGIGTLKYGTVGNWDGSDTTVMLRDVTVANYEATLRIRIADVYETLAAVICRVPAAWNDGGTGIHVNFNPGDVTLRVEETVSWTGTLIGSAPLSQASGTWYRLRIRLSGTSVQVRAWPDGQAEPGSWSVSGTAPSVTAAGRIGVRAGGGAAAANRKVDVDDWNIVALSGGGGPTTLTVTYSGSSWSHTPAQVSAARTAGSTIVWAATTVPPTAANGLVNGDTVTGTFTNTTPAEPPAGISIPSNKIPVANDIDGATSDTVVLSRVHGVSWVVDGVTHPSGSMTETTKSVPYTKGVNTVVTAVPETAAFKLIDVTTSWTLTFTDVVNNATTVTLNPAQYPVVTDNPGVADDYVTLTSVEDVTWTVGGIDYPSADFTGTMAVASYAGTTVTVTAKPARPGVTLAGTTSWSADFTNTGTPGTPMQMVSSSAFSTIEEGALPASPLVGAMDARYGGTVSDLSHNGNSKLTGYTGGGSLYLNGYGPSVTFMPADIIKTRGVEARIYSPQSGTKATGSRLELHKTTGNGVSLRFANADVKVETYGTAWTTLSTLTGLGARGAVWFIGYDDATHKITVKKDGAVVYTGDYTYNGSAATAIKYTAESGSYSTTIDDVKVYSA